MTRMRTLVAAAILTIPMLTVSATTPVDQSTQVMRESPLPGPRPVSAFLWRDIGGATERRPLARLDHAA